MRNPTNVLEAECPNVCKLLVLLWHLPGLILFSSLALLDNLHVFSHQNCLQASIFGPLDRLE